jgi:hypothetical protein
MKTRYGINIMKKQFVRITLFSMIAFGAGATEANAQSCEQLREQIESQTGVLPSVNSTLLRDISVHQECRFSSAEVYRAAFGDKPIPTKLARMSQAIDRGSN